MVAALVVWLAYAPAEVLGTGDCPAAAEVSRRLTEMLPAAGGGPPGTHVQHRARIGRTGDAIVVELLLPSDQVIARRDLVASGSCDDLAAAVAVIVAAWEAELDPHLTARVNLPAPAAEPVARAQLGDDSEPPPRAASFQIGLAVLGSVVGGQLAPGAGLAGWIAPPGWHLGLALELSGTTARSEAVGVRANAASWTRYALGVGPEAQLTLQRATLDLRAQALAALLHVEGVGLSTTASDSSDCGKQFLCQIGTCACGADSCTVGKTNALLSFDLSITNERADGSVIGSLGQHNVHITQVVQDH